jgi:uncharacterized protein YodC (DUF2158 family)
MTRASASPGLAIAVGREARQRRTAMNFKKGDIVQLKSGGPAMVVTGEAGDGVQVLWYGEIVDEIKTGNVPAICLVEAELEEAEDENFGRR